MNKNRYLRLVLMSILVLTGAQQTGFTALMNAHADDDDDDAPSRLHQQQGLLGIVLSPETQRISGVQVQEVMAADYRRELRAVAEVVDLRPLLSLRSQVNVLRAEQAVGAIALNRSREAYERLRALHADSANISDRQLEEARAELQSAEARHAASRQQLQDLQIEASQTWGATLVDAIFAEQSALLTELKQQQSVVLLLTLTRETGLADQGRLIFVNHTEDRRNARRAQWLSAAPQTDPRLQGETHYFKAPAKGLRVGQRILAWVPLTDELESGVWVPNDAVVWQGNRQWIYRREGAEFFYRQALLDAERVGDDWFVPASEIAAGTAVVVRGAQMLMSEEYRWQIPDEDDD
ncbi:MAG: hypothetical protein WD572_08000 [Gammaproteobacteria bacterium]